MAFPVLGIARPQFLDENGDPYDSGTITIVNPSDDVAKATYPTADDADAATNGKSTAYTLNQRGEPAADIWGVDGQTYKVTLKDSAAATKWTIDDIAWADPAETFADTIIHIARTQAESDADIAAYTSSNTIGDIVVPHWPPGDIRRYGALTATANNKAAIQAAVNQNSFGGVPTFIPAGRWKHTAAIYYHYDAANNPLFNDGVGRYFSGNVWIKGEQHSDYAAEVQSFTVGSILEFNPASNGIGHYAGDGTVGDTENSAGHRNIHFENLSIVGTTTDYLMQFSGVSRDGGLFFCQLLQKGTGGGVKWIYCWGIKLHHTRLRTNNGSNVGIGLESRQPSSNGGGGNQTVKDSSVKSFGAAQIQIGAFTGAGSAEVAHANFSITGTQFAAGTYGLRVGESVGVLTIDRCFSEGSTISQIVCEESIPTINILNSYIRGADCTESVIRIGKNGGNDWTTRWGALTIQGCRIRDVADNRNAIELNYEDDTGAAWIGGNTFTGDDTSSGVTGVAINGSGEGVSLDGNNFGVDDNEIDTEYSISGSGQLDFYRSGNPVDSDKNTSERGTVMLKGMRVSGSKEYTNSDTGGNIDLSYPIHRFNSTGGVIALTVADGLYDGQQLYFVLRAYTNDVALTFTTRSGPLAALGVTAVFGAANEDLHTIWDGLAWRLTYNNGVA